MKFENKIECARFNNGSFMNYLGHGIFPDPEAQVDEEKQLTKLQEGGCYAIVKMRHARGSLDKVTSRMARGFFSFRSRTASMSCCRETMASGLLLL
jgi:hypothetical protein